MSNAQAGFGTILKYGAGTVIGELTNIGGPNQSADAIEVTNHQSPDGFREFIGGLKDGGEVTFEGNFLGGDAGQVAIGASFISGAVESFVIVFPNGYTWTFSGIVTAREVSPPMDDKLPFSGTIKISGKPVLGS